MGCCAPFLIDLGCISGTERCVWHVQVYFGFQSLESLFGSNLPFERVSRSTGKWKTKWMQSTWNDACSVGKEHLTSHERRRHIFKFDGRRSSPMAVLFTLPICWSLADHNMWKLFFRLYNQLHSRAPVQIPQCVPTFCFTHIRLSTLPISWFHWMTCGVQAELWYSKR